MASLRKERILAGAAGERIPGATILLVEDDARTRRLYRSTLEHAGFGLAEAESFDRAVAVMNDSIGVALLDVMLGSESGLKVLEYIHRKFPFCPVIMISAYADKESAIAALQEGAVDYLEKPVDRERLVHTIRHWLEIARLRQENVRLQSYQAMYQAVRESEEKYRLLMQGAVDAIFIADAETGLLLEANARAERLTGRRRDELVGMHQGQLHPASEAETYQGAFRGHVESGGSMAAVLASVQHRDGRVIPVEISAGVCEIGGRRVVQAIFRDISERQAREREAEELRQRHAQILEATQDGFWLVSLEGRLIEVNEAYCRMSGYSREELLAMRVSDIEAGERAEDVVRHIEAIMRNGHDRFETRHRRKDGSLLDLEISVSVFDGHGESPLMCGFLRDIGERKRAEESLWLLHRLVDETHDAIFVADPETGRFLEVNTRACASLGYSRGELLDMSVMDIETALPERTAWEEHVRRLRAAGFVVVQGEHRRKNGSLFPVEVGVRYVRHGGQAYLVTIARDISEHRQAERVLRESMSRAEALFDAITDAVFVHEIGEDGHVGKFLEVNDEACRHLGYTRQELLTLSPRDIDAPDSGVEIEPLVRRLFAEESIRFEQLHVGKEGRRIPVEIHARLFRYDGRDAVISLVRDISERKQAEASLKKYKLLFDQIADPADIRDDRGDARRARRSIEPGGTE